jgi:hypothetical protein
MFPMPRGIPLTQEESEAVEAQLVTWFRERGPYIYTPDFLRALRWSQRRWPDLRDHLERLNAGLAQRVGAALNRPWRALSCTRSTIAPEPHGRDPNAGDREYQAKLEALLWAYMSLQQ